MVFCSMCCCEGILAVFGWQKAGNLKIVRRANSAPELSCPVGETSSRSLLSNESFMTDKTYDPYEEDIEDIAPEALPLFFAPFGFVYFMPAYMVQNPTCCGSQNQLTLEGIDQFYVDTYQTGTLQEVEDRLPLRLVDTYQTGTLQEDILIDLCKIATLCDLWTIGTEAIIYCNTREKVEFLADQLGNLNFSISTMHSELDQKERDLVTARFRSGSSREPRRRALISTDLPALYAWQDVQQVPLVINFDLPQKMENYLHRVGRARRFGRRRWNDMVAITFVSNDEVWAIKDTERYYHTQIEEMPEAFANTI